MSIANQKVLILGGSAGIGLATAHRLLGIVSRKPMPGASAYASVGAAIEAGARTWALEYAPLRINTVVPGVIETDVWKQVMPADAVQAHFAQVSQALPVGRAGRPDDVARAVQFLIESPFITGAAIPVDGGHQLI